MAKNADCCLNFSSFCGILIEKTVLFFVFYYYSTIVSVFLIKQQSFRQRNRLGAINRRERSHKRRLPNPADYMWPEKPFGAARRGNFIRCRIILNYRSASQPIQWWADNLECNFSVRDSSFCSEKPHVESK